MIEQRDREYMEMAFALAKEAAEDGEVPVGAVLVFDGKVAGVGRNRRQVKKNALCHAEIEAIDNACRNLGGWRLHKGELYVTLEPCPMCAGAALSARVKRIVYGASDKTAGALGSVLDLNEYYPLHRAEVEKGLMECECTQLLSDFFKELRRKRKAERSEN
jgi:tRNA(adenine34) deaminase